MRSDAWIALYIKCTNIWRIVLCFSCHTQDSQYVPLHSKYSHMSCVLLALACCRHTRAHEYTLQRITRDPEMHSLIWIISLVSQAVHRNYTVQNPNYCCLFLCELKNCGALWTLECVILTSSLIFAIASIHFTMIWTCTATIVYTFIIWAIPLILYRIAFAVKQREATDSEWLEGIARATTTERERKMWNEWIENKRKKWKLAPIKCLHIPCNEKWLFRMTGCNCAVLLRIMSEMNRQKDGHGNEMKWPANPMHANEIAFVCQITQFCINCFSSDEAHKFTHKYFAVERIFAVEMQLMPLKLYWYVWFTPLSAHMSVSTAQICAYLAFHQFEHYVSQCVCVPPLLASISWGLLLDMAMAVVEYGTCVTSKHTTIHTH